MPLAAATGRLAAAQAELAVRARRDMAGEGVAVDDCRYDYAVWSADHDNVTEQPLANLANGGPEARLTLKAVYELPATLLVRDEASAGTPAPSAGTLELNWGAGAQSVNVYSNATLKPGTTAVGPCSLKGDYLTCLIGQGWKLRVTSNQDLVLEVAKS